MNKFKIGDLVKVRLTFGSYKDFIDQIGVIVAIVGANRYGRIYKVTFPSVNNRLFWLDDYELEKVI